MIDKGHAKYQSLACMHVQVQARVHVHSHTHTHKHSDSPSFQISVNFVVFYKKRKKKPVMFGGGMVLCGGRGFLCGLMLRHSFPQATCWYSI